MTTRLEIKFIRKSGGKNYYDGISQIVVKYPDGTLQPISEGMAIDQIRSGNNSFFVSQGGNPVNVTYVMDPNGHEYLRTLPDDKKTNNLLSLPEYP